MPFKEVGNFVARGAGRVDPRLVAILQAAAERAGLNIEAYSGYRPGDPRMHGQGKATDVRIIGENGQAIPNYQNAQSFEAYERFAQAARQAQMAQYPDLGGAFRWGGYFGGPKGKYGAMDLMHFDLGGRPGLGMAGGSWESGLTDAQRALFPGVTSHGGGKYYAPQASGTPAPPMGAPIQVGDAPVAAVGATPMGPDAGPEAPQSALGKLFSAFGQAGGAMSIPDAATAPSVTSDGGYGATIAAQQGAEKTRALAAGLRPDVEGLLGLGAKRRMPAMLG